VARRYGIGFALSVAVFVLSAFVPPPWRFILWGIGLTSDLVTPITTLPYQARLPRIGSSKIPERFGLFVIIVLGEAMVGVIQGVAGQAALTVAAALTGALGLALVFGLWWLYFDFIGRRAVRPGIWWSLAWNYLHLPLVMTIAAISAGVQNVLAPHGGDSYAGALRLLAGGVALALLVIAALELTLRPDPDEPSEARASIGLKLGAAITAVVLAILGGGLNPLALLGLLLLPILAPMLYGAYVWFRQPTAVVPHQ
jgi:low temperature requirement protein LtrA